jgi:hypothetical protein
LFPARSWASFGSVDRDADGADGFGALAGDAHDGRKASFASEAWISQTPAPRSFAVASTIARAGEHLRQRLHELERGVGDLLAVRGGRLDRRVGSPAADLDLDAEVGVLHLLPGEEARGLALRVDPLQALRVVGGEGFSSSFSFFGPSSFFASSASSARPACLRGPSLSVFASGFASSGIDHSSTFAHQRPRS